MAYGHVVHSDASPEQIDQAFQHTVKAIELARFRLATATPEDRWPVIEAISLMQEECSFLSRVAELFPGRAKDVERLLGECTLVATEAVAA